MIDINKKYRTKGGNEVRIYATDGGGPYPVHGAVLENGNWEFNTWNKLGCECWDLENHRDLVEVKPRIKRTVWLNVYLDDVDAYISKDMAGEFHFDRVACVKVEIDCEEGEGL